MVVYVLYFCGGFPSKTVKKIWGHSWDGKQPFCSGIKKVDCKYHFHFS